MASSDFEFDLDDRDQELIEALEGKLCDHDRDDPNDHDNQDDANCAIPDIDWVDDGDDSIIMYSNESGNISQIVGNDDGKIESIKGNIFPLSGNPFYVLLFIFLFEALMSHCISAIPW